MPSPMKEKKQLSMREELAYIVELVAKDGLPGPRDLDAALDAIVAVFKLFQGRLDEEGD